MIWVYIGVDQLLRADSRDYRAEYRVEYGIENGVHSGQRSEIGAYSVFITVASRHRLYFILPVCAGNKECRYTGT